MVNLCPGPMAGSAATHHSKPGVGIKALHVIPSLSAKHGGPSAAMPVLARALIDAGVTVTIVTTDDDGPGMRANVPLGVEITDKDGARYLYFRKNADFYKFSWDLTRWLWQHITD